MTAGHEEVLDLLRKWLGERTMLQCGFSFPAFRAFLRGRATRISSVEVALLSDEPRSYRSGSEIVRWNTPNGGYLRTWDISAALLFRRLLLHQRFPLARYISHRHRRRAQ